MCITMLTVESIPKTDSIKLQSKKLFVGSSTGKGYSRQKEVHVYYPMKVDKKSRMGFFSLYFKNLKIIFSRYTYTMK